MVPSSSYNCILLAGERTAEDSVSASLLGTIAGAAEHEMEQTVLGKEWHPSDEIQPWFKTLKLLKFRTLLGI